MTWLSMSENRQYPWYIRLLFAFLARRGSLTEPVRLWARSPRVFLSFLRLFKTVDRKSSPIEPSLRSLVMVRVSQINVCAFCVDLNGSRAIERGIAADKLAVLDQYEHSPLFTVPERAALAFADAVTTTGAKVTPLLRHELRRSFSDDAIIELSALIAFQNMSSKFNFGLDVPAGGFCVARGDVAEPVASDR